MRIHAALVATLASIPSAQTGESFPGTSRFDLTRPDIQQFVEQTARENGLEVDDVYGVLAKAEPQPKILEAIARPAERVVPWWEYRERFVTAQRIRDGVQFWGEHRERLEAVSRTTGVAPEYIVAILGVETSYGRITGKYRVLDALATLAFDYPPRSPFFQSELANFLQLAREEPVDPLTALGSYAGAMGAPQFMPSSYRRYATDGDGDGRRDLFSDWNDVIASVANYFAAHGWKAGGPVLIEATVEPDVDLALDVKNLALTETLASARARGVRFESDLPDDTPVILVPAELKDGTAVRIGFGNFETITRYNRSVRYAMAVHDLAQALAAGVYESS